MIAHFYHAAAYIVDMADIINHDLQLLTNFFSYTLYTES